jgi:hypothetical protein
MVELIEVLKKFMALFLTMYTGMILLLAIGLMILIKQLYEIRKTIVKAVKWKEFQDKKR